MSIEVSLDDLFADLGTWGFGYLATVSEDGRVHMIALRPTLGSADGVPTLRFDAGGGRACRNAAARPDVTVVFPPHPGSDGMSLIVDGAATVDGDFVGVAPTWAVMHRRAP